MPEYKYYANARTKKICFLAVLMILIFDCLSLGFFNPSFTESITPYLVIGTGIFLYLAWYFSKPTVILRENSFYAPCYKLDSDYYKRIKNHRPPLKLEMDYEDVGRIYEINRAFIYESKTLPPLSVMIPVDLVNFEDCKTKLANSLKRAIT